MRLTDEQKRELRDYLKDKVWPEKANPEIIIALLDEIEELRGKPTIVATYFEGRLLTQTVSEQNELVRNDTNQTITLTNPNPNHGSGE